MARYEAHRARRLVEATAEAHHWDRTSLQLKEPRFSDVDLEEIWKAAMQAAQSREETGSKDLKCKLSSQLQPLLQLHGVLIWAMMLRDRQEWLLWQLEKWLGDWKGICNCASVLLALPQPRKRRTWV
eukprot:symbB.v1.2.021319.t1/scaffold1837.1/size99322/7